MGTDRLKSRRLAEKLLQIREALGLSQSEMLRRLAFDDVLPYTRISDYELGKREPPYPMVLQYARAVKISTDVLIDDELDLPAKLPTRK
ncbi:MAG: Helix-turn-helix domain [Acidobacteriota bacterium]|jgi:transcriptional regulator with XRE-family HTH domain|nr:Helix-turn-helix domain [Acidobacteriota bacterium]